MLDINTKEDYDLATALRGPDLQYPKLKYIITGWIRGQLNLVHHCFCQVRHGELTAHDVNMAKGEVEHLFACPHQHSAMYHWLRHAASAIVWLRDSRTDPVGRREEELIHALIGMIRHPANVITKNKERVLRYLDDWLNDAPKIQVYDIGNTHRRR